jgi:hypothetical protein
MKMAVKFYKRTITSSMASVGSGSFQSRFYIGAPGDFVVEPTMISGSTDDGADALTWASQGIFGTNASLFDQNSTRVLTALHVYQNQYMQAREQQQRDMYGNLNYEDWYLDGAGNGRQFPLAVLYASGTAVYLLHKAGSKTVSMDWGIGGLDLDLGNNYVGSTATDVTFHNYLKSTYNYGDGTQPTPRTAIGYRYSALDGPQVVLAAIFGNPITKFSGPTVYQVRQIMRYLGCSSALCLDGSYSTKVSFKDGTPLTNTGLNLRQISATESTDGTTSAKGTTRQTWARIRLTATAAGMTNGKVDGNLVSWYNT